MQAATSFSQDELPKFMNAKQQVKGRFAPSPTGRMHAGNIFAALCAWLVAKSQGGNIVLRIEDLDRDRSKPCYIDSVQRDFELLGLTWDEGPYFQSDREEAYRAAFEEVREKALVYPCFCSRADLHAASAPHAGERFAYPRTCLALSEAERAAKAALRPPAMRLQVPDERVSFVDALQGPYSENLALDGGDFVLQRFDGTFAYQLAVVVDDAAQGVNSVVRGVDLLPSCAQQMHLQDLLCFKHPKYAHVPLLVDGEGRRLAKRNRDAALDELIARFKTAEAVLGHIAGITGLMPTCEPASAEDILGYLRGQDMRALLKDLKSISWE